MRSRNGFFPCLLLCMIIHNTLTASFERIYHKNPFQQVRAQIVTTKTTASKSIEIDAMQCPICCVCQYARFNDLPLSRWINNMQNERFKTTTTTTNDDKNNTNEGFFPTNDNNNASEQEDEKKHGAGDLTDTNPYIKQATCILQTENDVTTLINMLPHDLQALILLYTGMAQNETINMSLLKPLKQLNTLEIRGSQERSLRLVFDEPLPFLLHANFEFVTLMGSENAMRPKSSTHPRESFNYKPKGELQIVTNEMEPPMNAEKAMDQLHRLYLQQDNKEEVEILPYDVYVEDLKKARMPRFFGWQQLLVLRVHACELKELQWEMFDGLESLQHLSLERNSIELVPPFALYGVRNIKTLSLAHNSINRLHYRDLAGLLELEKLDLSFNHLHKLSEMTFPPFPKLQYADFRQNVIKYIFPAAFWVMNSTKYMYFDSNDISLELWNNEPFDTLRNLKTLEIANISVDTLQQNMFKGLSSLEKLRLRGRIHSIEFDAFVNLINVRELILSECQINEISMDAFIGCKHLELLDLSYNNISYLPVGLFDEQTMLEEIYLQHNQLRTLPTSFFLQPKLHLVRLHDNPWKCSCAMSNWLPRITNQLSSQRTECKRSMSNKLDRRLAPRCENHNGRSVSYVVRKQLQCNLQHKRNNNIKQSVPHWRKIQLFNVTTKAKVQKTQKHMIRHTGVEKNSIDYALQSHNALGGSDNNNNNSKNYNINSRNYKEEISNEV